jgi:putative GTP pyrophosphokinase
VTDTDKEKATFDFESHRRVAVEDYRRQLSLYESFAREVKEILDQAIISRGIRASDIQARAKTTESFGKKAITPSEQNPGDPKYKNPITDITDLAGVRVITFFPRTVEEVCRCITEEFEMVERVDHTASALQEERLGYQSVHLLVKLASNRTRLSEYRKFDGLLAEIQVRTIMQHAWAEIEHDIRYKSPAAIPKAISRRFMTLAGLLEVADREFQAIQDDDKAIRENARTLIEQNRLHEVELTPDALNTYLDMRLGSDDRISEYSYEWMTRILRGMGFVDLGQVDQCIAGLPDDKLSRLAMGGRQGQMSRFEVLLLVGMGDNFLRNHPWNQYAWYKSIVDRRLEKLREGGVTTGAYQPPKPDQQAGAR